MKFLFQAAVLCLAFAENCSTKKEQEAQIIESLRNFSEVISVLNHKSYRSVEIKKFIEDALKQAVPKLDPHSAYLPNYQQTLDGISGNFSGIGVNILNKNAGDEHLLVIDTLEGSPAHKEGLLAGDKILAIDGISLKGINLEDTVSKIRGPRGSVVDLKVLRNKKILNFKVKRDTISEQFSLAYLFESHQIFYLNLKSFTESSSTQMRKVVEKINESKDIKGVILDLRGNPGGLMEASVEIASLFVPKKSLVVFTKDRNNLLQKEYRTDQDPILKRDISIFVLINNFTASAAEILAGSLKFHAEEMEKNNIHPRPKIFLMGTTTFGKGSVQEVIPISHESAIKITTLLYFLPSNTNKEGESVQARGVKPDFFLSPKRNISIEEKFLFEMYGKEKTIQHHITQEEISYIAKNQKPCDSSEIDKKTTKKIEKFESVFNELEESGKKDKPLEKVEDLFETISKEDFNKDEEDSKNMEQKRVEALMDDYYIQTATHMIAFLDLQKKISPEKINNLSKCKDFLKNNFFIGERSKIKKVNF